MRASCLPEQQAFGEVARLLDLLPVLFGTICIESMNQYCIHGGKDNKEVSDENPTYLPLAPTRQGQGGRAYALNPRKLSSRGCCVRCPCMF